MGPFAGPRSVRNGEGHARSGNIDQIDVSRAWLDRFQLPCGRRFRLLNSSDRHMRPAARAFEGRLVLVGVDGTQSHPARIKAFAPSRGTGKPARIEAEFDARFPALRYGPGRRPGGGAKVARSRALRPPDNAWGIDGFDAQAARDADPSPNETGHRGRIGLRGRGNQDHARAPGVEQRIAGILAPGNRATRLRSISGIGAVLVPPCCFPRCRNSAIRQCVRQVQ